MSLLGENGWFCFFKERLSYIYGSKGKIKLYFARFRVGGISRSRDNIYRTSRNNRVLWRKFRNTVQLVVSRR